MAPAEDEDDDVAMAQPVGILNDDDIMPDATVEEALRGIDVLSAPAGAIGPSAFREEADFGGTSPKEGSTHSSPQRTLAAVSISTPAWGFGNG